MLPPKRVASERVGGVVSPPASYSKGPISNVPPRALPNISVVKTLDKSTPALIVAAPEEGENPAKVVGLAAVNPWLLEMVPVIPVGIDPVPL